MGLPADPTAKVRHLQRHSSLLEPRALKIEGLERGHSLTQQFLEVGNVAIESAQIVLRVGPATIGIVPAGKRGILWWDPPMVIQPESAV